jgi:hypothetical protein
VERGKGPANQTGTVKEGVTPKGRPGGHERSGPNREAIRHPTIHLVGTATERERVKAKNV